MTLRTKLALSFGGMAVVVAALMGALGYLVVANRVNADADARLLSTAQRLMSSPHDLSDGDRFGPPPGRPGEGYDSTVALVGADGTVRPVRGDSGITALPGDTEIASSTTARYTIRQQGTVSAQYRVLVGTDGNGRAAVLVADEWSEQSRTLRTLAVVMAVLALVLSAVAALAGWLLARRIAARLEVLTTAAEHVSDTGELGVAVPGAGGDEVGRLAAAFNSMLGRLATSQSEQQRLVQDAGHELRTPLTSMRTNISLLGRFEDLPPDARGRVIADLRGESRELTHLVNELLEAASGTLSSGEPQTVVLADVVARVAARARRKTDHIIETDCDTTAVIVDPAALERAVWNLVDNAVKFSPAGSPVTIEVADGSLRVLDRGPGVPALDRSRIFERFYRPVTSRSLPGSGLGLAIVQDFTRMNNARIDVLDRPGGGTVFSMRFLQWKPAVE